MLSPASIRIARSRAKRGGGGALTSGGKIVITPKPSGASLGRATSSATSMVLRAACQRTTRSRPGCAASSARVTSSPRAVRVGRSSCVGDSTSVARSPIVICAERRAPRSWLPSMLPRSAAPGGSSPNGSASAGTPSSQRPSLQWRLTSSARSTATSAPAGTLPISWPKRRGTTSSGWHSPSSDPRRSISPTKRRSPTRNA